MAVFLTKPLLLCTCPVADFKGSPDSDLRTGLTQGFTKGAGAMSKLARSLAAKAPRMGDMGLKLAKGLFNSKSNLQEEQSESLDQPQTQQLSHQDPDPQQEVQQPQLQPQLHPQARSRPQSQSQAEPCPQAQLQASTQPQTQPQQEVQSYVQGQVQALQQQQQQPHPRVPKPPSLIVLQPDYFDDAGAPLSSSARWSGSGGGRGSSSVHGHSQETAQTALEPKSTAGAVGESDVSATTGYDFAAVDGDSGGSMMLTAEEELSPVGRFERQSVGRAVDLNQQQQQQPGALNEADAGKGGPVGEGTPPDSASADAQNAPPPSYAEATAFSDSPKHSDNAFARSGKSFANRPAAPSCLLCPRMHVAVVRTQVYARALSSVHQCCEWTSLWSQMGSEYSKLMSSATSWLRDRCRLGLPWSDRYAQ